MQSVPTFDEYMNPILKALHELGGSATNQEIFEKVSEDMGLTDELLSIPHNPERGNQTEVAYRMAWARTYLKQAGYIENSERGVWALTPQGRQTESVDPRRVVSLVRSQYVAKQSRSLSSAEQGESGEPPDLEDETSSDAWRSQLMSVLSRMMPDSFERLAQRLLRECGFVEVDVTGRTGDGGIDGRGILRVQNLVSFQVLFQCKRWAGTVGAKEIRDFRGAMVGRTDKGLFITTGSFSRDAQKEATRDGAPPIDLIDGEQLLDLLKNLELGVQRKVVEKIIIDEEWFQSI
ncbi:restriction endonuclease [Litorilinea aerophila]|uniref:Restriction endonuclease n=1 Tax=Litorilinea aerophila TaxID=1204385 RepID=A0A540VK20_9CHLR|nr:restriction endonuclease [Litorilinea aerophila]MCC9075207.1 restriction endonuclease [Litorilinea aerophila]